MSWFDEEFPTNPGERVYYVFWHDETVGGYNCWLAASEAEATAKVHGEKDMEVLRVGSFPTAKRELAEELLDEACGYEETEDDECDVRLHPDWVYYSEEEVSEEESKEREQKQAEYYCEERLDAIWAKLDCL